MAQSVISLGYEKGINVYEETVLDSVKKQVKLGAHKIYNVDVDNASVAQVYVKAYFAAAGDVTVGTTDPDEILAVPASVRKSFQIVIPDSLPFPTALTLACVTTPGTGGVTNPAANVGVRVTVET